MRWFWSIQHEELDLLVGLVQTPGQLADHAYGDLGAAADQVLEGVLVDHHDLRVLGHRGGRGARRLEVDDGHLAEEVARPEHRQHVDAPVVLPR